MCTVITSGPTFLEHRSWVQALYRIKSTDLFLRCSWDSVFLNENTFLEIELLIWEVLQLFHSGFAAWTCQWTEICLNLVMTAFTFFVVVGSRHWKKNDVGKRSKHETMMRTHYWISFSKSLTQILKFCFFFFFPSVSRCLWSSVSRHAAFGAILSVHWARPCAFVWWHRRASWRCSRSRPSWRQVPWEPCCSTGQIPFSAELSPRSGPQRTLGCSLFPAEVVIWQDMEVNVCNVCTFRGLEYPDCNRVVVFIHVILPMQSAVHYQELEI